MGEQRELEVKVEHLVVDVEEKQMESATKTREESVGDVGANARSWFVQLSNEERMVALSFSDDLFIDALLKVASSSSSSRTIAEGSEAAALPAHAVLRPHSPGVEWERMFMIKEFAKLYEAFKEITNVEVAVESESVDNTSPSIPSESKVVNEEEVTPKQPIVAEESVTEKSLDMPEELDVDDAFRIHRSVENAYNLCDEGKNTEGDKALAIANGKKAAALALSSLAERAHNSRCDASQMHQFTKNLHLVFPSVVEFAQGSTVTENISSPILMLTPSFLEKTSGNDLLRMFDVVLSSGDCAPFLSESVYRGVKALSDSTANNWLLRLCGSNGEKSIDMSQTSVSLLVVARLEYAVYEAYVGRRRSRRALGDLDIKEDVEDVESKPFSSLPEEADGSSSDQWASAPEEECGDSDERSLEGPNPRGEHSANEFFDADSSEKTAKDRDVNTKILSPVCYIEMKGPIMSSRKCIVSSLSASIHAFEESYEKHDLSEVMSPMLDLIGNKGIDDSLPLKASNLMMTPLIWFFRPAEGVQMDVKMISDAVESSLKRLTYCTDSETCIEFPAHNSAHATCVTVTSMAVTDIVDSGEGGLKQGATTEQGATNPDGCVDGVETSTCIDNIDTSTSTKKLKKKKKKKKRKSMNVDAETKDVQSMETSEQGREVENLDRTDPVEDLPGEATPHNAPSIIQECTVATLPSPETGKSPEADDNVVVESDPSNIEVDDSNSGTETRERDHVTTSTEMPVENETSEADDHLENGGGPQDESGHGDDDGSAWETVEARTRASRKKSGDRGHHGSGRSGSNNHFGQHGSYSSFNGMNGSFSKKSKAARTPASRKRGANRKIVREILTSVLDAVDEELTRRKKPTPRIVANSNAAQAPPAPAFMQRVENSKPVTMRDLVIGVAAAESSETTPKPASQSSATITPGSVADSRSPTAKNSDSKRATGVDARCEPAVEKPRMSSKTIADQNTAPTVPETMSAVSANSMNTEGLFGAGSFRRRSETGVDQDVTRSDSSSEELIEAEKDLRISCSTTDEKDSSPAPPLPTLLSPGNADSASSSVASSLEVPHGHHHHRSYSATENVGYHLLDVCDRLTRDMNVFMDRRGLALNVRRRERGELLTALQDTLSKLWPGRCNVNMYGSCATQLDLPSSDLDVVVCGLDRKGEAPPNNMHPHPKSSNKKSGRRGNTSTAATESQAAEFSPRGDSQTKYAQTQTGTLQYSPFSPFNPVQLVQSINGERVIRLAAELERQPWAVHVKAVPTATVPVVKILADPAKLPGAKVAGASASDWMSHHQHMAAIAAGISSAVSSSSGPHYHPLHTPLPWRGADVMNGLMSVDITFEGPEHGGIGSTKLSSRIVKDACDEYSCPPERVPLVQVLMVLKEMLAQRRLNEPFSGGLSSYALLLLVEALVKERAVIREELERVERQRRVVAAGGGNASLGENNARKTKADRDVQHRDQIPVSSEKATGQTFADTMKGKSLTAKSKRPQESPPSNPAPKVGENGSQSNNPNASSGKAQPTLRKAASASSWASVAKKNTSSIAPAASEQQRQDEPAPVVQPVATQSTQPKPKTSTFADAVARSVDVTKASVSADNKRPVRAENKVDAASKNDASKSQKNPIQSSIANSHNIHKPNKQETRKPEKPAVPSPPVETSDNGPQPQTRFNSSTISIDSALVGAPQLFPQGSNDVVEVLCSGDTTAGKLLMHFLLFYGQHFDARSTAIDVSGKHPDANRHSNRTAPYVPLSPYIQRRPGGTIDLISGMLTVDPIVVYDPLEGAESNNVARSCFLWSNIRWVFAQSYNTLSSAVERSPTPPTTPGRQQQPQKVLTSKVAGAQSEEAQGKLAKGANGTEMSSWQTPFVRDDAGQLPVDSLLLELLLSF